MAASEMPFGELSSEKQAITEAIRARCKPIVVRYFDSADYLVINLNKSCDSPEARYILSELFIIHQSLNRRENALSLSHMVFDQDKIRNTLTYQRSLLEGSVDYPHPLTLHKDNDHITSWHPDAPISDDPEWWEIVLSSPESAQSYLESARIEDALDKLHDYFHDRKAAAAKPTYEESVAARQDANNKLNDFLNELPTGDEDILIPFISAISERFPIKPTP